MKKQLAINKMLLEKIPYLSLIYIFYILTLLMLVILVLAYELKNISNALLLFFQAQRQRIILKKLCIL